MVIYSTFYSILSSGRDERLYCYAKMCIVFVRRTRPTNMQKGFDCYVIKAFIVMLEKVPE